MPAKPSAYLVQLRDQIASTFDLEELRTIAFDLQLDWDELVGSRKTTRIQDLITQLGRNGRLEELVEILRRKRPNITWPDPPTIDQQRQLAATNQPSKPFMEKRWFLGLAAVVALLAGFAGIWADSGLRDWLFVTPTPSVIPQAGWIIFVRQAETVELAQDSLQELMSKDYANIIFFEKEDSAAALPFVVALGPYPSQAKAMEQLALVKQEIGDDAYVGQLSLLCPNECKSIDLPKN